MMCAAPPVVTRGARKKMGTWLADLAGIFTALGVRPLLLPSSGWSRRTASPSPARGAAGIAA